MLRGSNDTRRRLDGSIFYVDSNLETAASLTTNRAVYDRLLACLCFGWLHSFLIDTQTQRHANSLSYAFRFAQISSRHFGWLFLTEKCKHCRRDIFQCPSFSQLRSDRCFVDKVKRYGIDCMRSVRSAS